MTEEEFSLSEKIIPYCWVEDRDKNGNKTNMADALYEDETIETKDVKEFIQNLREGIKNMPFVPRQYKLLMLIQISKYAGEKLI